MATDSGFSNQKKKGIAQYETIQHLGSSKYGKAVSGKALFEKLPTTPIVSVTDVIGSNGQVEFWNVELTAHTALVGDVLRIEDATLLNFEFDIVQVVDVDNFRILPISDVIPAAGMDASIMGWVTQKVDSTGSAIMTPSPIQFVLDGVDTEVEEDTVTPANTISLPVKDIGLNAKDFATETTLSTLNGKVPTGLTVVANELKVAANIKSALLDVAYDQIVLTYVGATTDIATVVAKKVGVTVATLTLTYDGSNRLVDVTRT